MEMIVAGCGLEIFMLQTTQVIHASCLCLASAALNAGDIVRLPSAHHCRPARTMTLRVLPSADSKVSAVAWSVGARHHRITGAALSRPFTIRRLPRGAYTVHVVVTLANGTRLSEHRRYRTCHRTT
jgi:hypothetical protein